MKNTNNNYASKSHLRFFKIKVSKNMLTEVVPVTGQPGRSTAVSTALEHTNNILI